MGVLNVGIIGGGQLGSLLCEAAKKIGINAVVYSDDIDSPAKFFTKEFIHGNYADEEKISNFCSKVNFVTYEFENIPFKTLNNIKKLKKVSPDPEILKIVQNRLLEKEFLNKINLKTTLFKEINSKKDLFDNSNLLPGFLKTCRFGYDGKGQYFINNISEIEGLDIKFENKYILEKKVSLKKEVSVIITRYGKNEYSLYDPIENFHKDQILRTSIIPAEISQKNKEDTLNFTRLISEKLKYIGTMCVEFFIDSSDNLYINEIAPRVHNSGHLTLNSYNVSQFENHIRAVCGKEKIELKKLNNSKMINLIGDDILLYRSKKFNKNEFFYDYKKKVIKPKRKMGHFTKVIL